jgi:S1/P1 nuclease
MLRALFLLTLLQSQALAWNGLGHKVVAEIAWQQLVPQARQQIVDTIRRHPAFDRDFAKDLPEDDKAVQDHWIFQQAATWPDIARKTEYDRPSWHYIDVPLFTDGERQVTFNLLMDYPTQVAIKDYNIAQATKHCQAVIADHGTGADAKALANCWLMHLVGDMHQPLHSTALVCEHFPNGDKGGNEISVVQGKNLHSLWDNLLGRRARMQDVERIVAELKQNPEDWKIEQGDVEGWIAESHEMAKSFTYDPIILQAVKEAQPGEKLTAINLPESYLKQAGRLARQRIVAAGIRLGGILKVENQ